MYATASASPSTALTRKGSRGDNSSEGSWTYYNASKSESGLSSRETEQILHYYYQSAEDGGESSSNDDSTTALQGHPRLNISIVTNSTVHRRSIDSSFSSSSGTVSTPIQRAGPTMATAAAPASVNMATEKHRSLIEMDTQFKTQNNQKIVEHATLSARRGKNDTARLPSLALREPSEAHSQQAPDAAPFSAPPIHTVFSIPDYSNAGHQRSMSDAQGKQHKRGRSSRDIGIVGTIGASLVPTPLDSYSYNQEDPPVVDTSDSSRLTLPLFQTPRSRSPSPSFLITPVATKHPPSILHGNQRYDDKMTDSELEETPTKETTTNHRFKHATSDTPRSSIERERDKQRNSARLAFKPAQPPAPSYLYYQPGLHSTAGPLPSPPRRIHTLTASNPPPRPPRLTPQSRPASSERNQPSSPEITSSRLPFISTPSGSSDYSLTAVSITSENEQAPQTLAVKPDEQRISLSSETEGSDGAVESFYTSNHTREGAFGISVVEPPSKVSSDVESKEIHDNRSIEGKVETSSVSAYDRSSQSPIPDSIQSEDKGNPTSSLSLALDPAVAPPPSPPSSYESSSEIPVKLPPLPVLLQKRTSRRSSLPPPPPTHAHIADTFYQPMPSYLEIDLSNKLPSYSFPRPGPKRPPSSWPSVMNFKEILSMKSSKERASAYNVKFRELMLEETGLRDWVNSAVKKDRSERNLGVPSIPVNHSSTRQIRHVSRGSIASEATFPIRQDAYTATDLMSKPVADLPSPITAPPTLPYPSLAQGIGVRKRSSKNFSVESPLVSPVGSTKSLSGGFFASIGRKASLRRERTLPPVSPNKQPVSLLQIPKNNTSQPPTRVIKLEHAPTLPGGPRAPPRSAHRSSTLIYPRRTEETSPSKHNSVSPARRSAESNRSFNRELDRMVDLLPHVDKAVLSSYLHRAKNNDSMAAISNYLEDEKNGDVRVS